VIGKSSLLTTFQDRDRWTRVGPRENQRAFQRCEDDPPTTK